MTPSDLVSYWLAPPPGTYLPGLDLELLDPADEDDRALLIRAQHPDFAAAIERGDNEVEVGGEQVNPRLHLAMHEVVANQLWEGDPPETRRTAERLLEDGYDRHEVLHMVGSVVAGQLWSALRTGAPVDPDDYVAALAALPDDWDAQPSEEPEQPGPDDLDLATDDIDEADEEAFEQTREWLLEGHQVWLADQGLEEDDWVAYQLLHHKWGYLDGHLGRWRVADLDEILLSLFPRKVVIDADDLPRVVPAAAHLLRYLDDAGLLSPQGDTLPRLLQALHQLERPFLDAMRDPSNFGMGKSLFGDMTAAGVDLEDRDAVEAWITEFNALPDDERARRLPRPIPDRTLPPMALPDDDTLAAQALDAPAMRQVAAFIAWVGDGRALTQKGNLKLAYGKELIDLLGTDDRFDETIGDRQFKTHSTTDLPGIDLVYRLALKARLVRKHRGSVRGTKRGGRLADEPLDVWREVMLAMLDIGMVGAGREDYYGLRWWEGYLEEGVVELLTTVARGGSPLPVDVLSKAAYDGLAADYDLDALPETPRTMLPDSMGWGVGRLVDRLVWLGAATRDGVTVERDQWGSERRAGGELALTDLGRWFVRPVLVDQGYEVPVAGELADAPVEVLLEAIGDWPLEAVHAEIRAWAAARDTAVDELAAAARQVGTPDLRALVFEALEVIGDDAVPAVRDLTGDPELRPWASLWLVQRGHSEPQTFDPHDAPAAFVQALAVALVAGGEEAVGEMLPDDATVGEQVRLVETLWRVDDPYTAPVLEALAAAGDKKVAKAARKALFKHRSAGPGRTT